MADTDIQTDNAPLNKMLSQNIGGLDAAMKKYIPADKEGAAKLNKEADEIKSYEDKVAFPTGKPPDKENTDPLQVMGSSAGWIATLGSLLTRHPLTSALNASAAAIGAAKEGDEQKYQEAMTKWKENDALIQKQQEWIMNKLKGAKGEDELRTQAHALGFPGVDTIFRTPGGAEKFMELYEKNYNDLRKHTGAAMNTVSEKMEKAGYVRDAMVQWDKEHPNASPLEKDKAKLGFQNEANNIVKEGNTSDKADVDWDSFKPNDIVPGTSSTYAEIKQKADARHNGASYSDLGLSTRTTKNPEKSAVDNLRAHLYADDDLAAIKTEYKGKQTEETIGAKNYEVMKVATDRLDKSIPLLMEKVKAVDPNRFKSWNEFENYLNENTGDPKIVALKQVVEDTKTDFQAVQAKGGQISDKVRASSDKVLNEAWATGQFKGAVETMLQTSKNQMDAAKESLDSVTKKGKKQSAEGIFNDGASKDYPIPVPKDKKFEVGKYYDLSAEGHGVHKYLGKGEFE